MRNPSTQRNASDQYATQYNTINATANAALGRKKRAWEYVTGPGQQLLHPSSNEQQLASSRRQATPSTLSNPISPHLPSPSPSEGHLEEAELATQRDGAFAQLQQAAPGNRGNDSVADKRARTEQPARQERPVRHYPSPFNLPGQSDYRRKSVGQGISSPSTTPLPLTPVARSNHSPSLQQVQSTPQGVPPHPNASVPPAQTAFAPPPSRSSSLGTLQHSSAVSQPVAHAQSPSLPVDLQQSPGMTLPWITQQQCLYSLQLFRSSYAIPDDNLRDGERLEVVERAVKEEDWAYLHMHQYYCLHTWEPNSLPAAIQYLPNLDIAMDIMAQSLDSNQRLSPQTLHFFTQFPAARPHLSSNYPQRLAQEDAKFVNFVNHSVNFTSLTSTCKDRNFPPLMRELVYDLGVSSQVFQRILFTATIRRLWCQWGGTTEPTKGPFEAQALNVFDACQTEFMKRYNGQPNHQPQSFQTERKERDQEVQSWGLQLAQLCDNMRRILQPPNPTARSAPAQQQQQVAATNRPPQQPMAHPQVQTYYFPSQISLARNPIPAMARQSAQTTQTATRGARPRGRPRMQQIQPRPQPVPVSQQSPKPTSARPLLPPPGFHVLQQRLPDPARFGTHQAHLRSPTIRARSQPATLYQYVKGFVQEPVRLGDASYKIETWTFHLRPEDLQRVPGDVASDPGAPPIRYVDEKSRMIRLRCVKWTMPVLPNEHTWSITDTSWVPYSYFTFNGVHLQQRKKTHHGKDLPIDLTCHAKEGENKLEIAVMRHRSDESFRKYLVAIEVIGFVNHSTIVNGCQRSNHIDAATTKAHIQRKLSGVDDDDELAIVESTITINLFDPFSASKMCDIPVRGKACLHYDCFDLETFLQTRKRAGDATKTDIWKCPICHCDVRPQHLMVDGFIEEVRDQLKEQGLEDTRAIIVDQSLAWKPKVEVLDGVADRDSPDADRRSSTSRQTSVPTNTRPTPVHAEVIDLSD
ncbi:hypothetical protein CC80DRAFT_493168 [Byssothecium circinans]|uniref:SP-RING-type domain-containing protein n=1 Tax=Byssothecium circinans TaxID=147558 RepID=A0A6A5TS42_9PLEO|nr:hypothetical protein CC80DRAFT_493168 [Byssothecium circinans]